MTVSTSSNASDEALVRVTEHHPNDTFIVTTGKKVKRYNSYQLNRTTIDISSEVCYEPGSPNNVVTIQFNPKTGIGRRRTVLSSSNRCDKPVSIFSDLIALVSNAQSKAFGWSDSYISALTKGGTVDKSNNIDNTEQPNPLSSCLNNPEIHHIQPKYYFQFFVPINNKYNGFNAQIFDFDNNKVIQNSVVINNFITFTNITIIEGKHYGVRLLDTDGQTVISQIDIKPRDIDSQRNSSSPIIPYYQKDETLSEPQNEVAYNVRIFDRSDYNFSYLYLDSLNKLLHNSVYLSNEERDITYDFVENYLRYYCVDSVSVPSSMTLSSQ